MASNSKIKNSSRNVLFSTINFIVQTVLKFAIRTVFLRYLTLQYLGINNLFVNVLSVLSLAELGVGQAIIYSLYKPVADGDQQKVLSLLALFKKLYMIIGGVVLLLGLIAMPLLPFLISDTPPQGVNLYIAYSVYLLNSIVGYFLAHRRAMLLASQRQSVETQVRSVQLIFLHTVQIVILVLWQSFYAYLVMIPVFTVLEALAIYIITRKMFPELRQKAEPLDAESKKGITKNTFAMLSHKVGYVLVYSTDSIVISAFLGSAALGVYSNYLLVTTMLATFLGMTITALSGSIGSLIAGGDREKIYKVFKSLNVLFMWMMGFFLAGMVAGFQDFMWVWMKEEQYLFPFIAMLMMSGRAYVDMSKHLLVAFREAAGLFYYDRFVPLIEAAINLALDVVLVLVLRPYGLGMTSVLLATIISMLCTRLWVMPVLLHKRLFEKKPVGYFVKYFVRTAYAVGVCALTYYICSFLPTGGVWLFVLKLLVATAVSNVLLAAYYLPTKDFKGLYQIVADFLKTQKKPKPREGT